MIQFRKLALARGARHLIEDASLQIHPGWRVGLVGANGSGKSSLFALLQGELHPEQGSVELPGSWTIAAVAQETPALQRPALEFVLDGDAGLRAIESALAEAELAGDGARLGALHARLEDIDGYGAPARAAALLAGLGFAGAEMRRPVAEFSGGWRMRLNLARALNARADLLLLDEPTNHLDLDAVVWLERWLANYPGTLLLVSHDRDFLDGCVTHIVHLHDRALRLYSGNYSAFEVQRAAQLAVRQAMFEKQQRTIAHLSRFVERFRAKATKARQAQSRLKALDRMEHISAAHVDAPFDFRFLTPGRSPDPLLALDRVSAGYGAVPVLRGLSLSLHPGSRLGLLGPNGAGKSTLVKLLAGELAPLDGTRVEGKGTVIGYFAQHQLEQLRADESPLAHLQRQEPGTAEQELRDYLGGFDFRGAMAEAATDRFSGGERSRLALALLLRRRPNLLLLDEPTNHLDLEMRHALTRALAEYEGSLVLVSHDRALLRASCDGFLLLADGQAREFAGDLEDYLSWIAERRASQAGCGVTAPGADRQARREARANAAAERQTRLARRRPLLKESAQLERQLAAWQTEKDELDGRLADPRLYHRPDPEGLEALSRRRGELSELIDRAEERWLGIQAELETLGEG